jgi:hypothetical protein
MEQEYRLGCRYCVTVVQLPATLFGILWELAPLE